MKKKMTKKSAPKVTKKRKPSRVMAKNVLVGDEFILRGQRKNAKVINSTTFMNKSKKKKNNSFTMLSLQFPSGTVHFRTIDANKRVWINENPTQHNLRRAMSRQKIKSGYVFID